VTVGKAFLSWAGFAIRSWRVLLRYEASLRRPWLSYKLVIKRVVLRSSSPRQGLGSNQGRRTFQNPLLDMCISSRTNRMEINIPARVKHVCKLRYSTYIAASGYAATRGSRSTLCKEQQGPLRRLITAGNCLESTPGTREA